MIDIDRPWVPVHIQPQPVVHFKSEYVWCGTYFKHYIVYPCAMNSSIWYQKQVVLFSRMRLNKIVDVYFNIFILTAYQRLFKFICVNILLKSKIYLGVIFTIEYIISLVLCYIFAKNFLNVFQTGMA